MIADTGRFSEIPKKEPDRLISENLGAAEAPEGPRCTTWSVSPMH